MVWQSSMHRVLEEDTSRPQRILIRFQVDLQSNFTDACNSITLYKTTLVMLTYHTIFSCMSASIVSKIAGEDSAFMLIRFCFHGPQQHDLTIMGQCRCILS